VAEIQGKDGAALHKVHAIIRIIGRKFVRKPVQRFLVKNHEKPTGMNVISTSKCVENYFQIDINRENTRKQPINTDFDAFKSRIERTYVGDCSPSIDMFMIYRIFSVHDSTYMPLHV
jgi:hypothetical protein